MITPKASEPRVTFAPAVDQTARFDMVAIDLDGTLLRSDKRLSLRVVESVIAASRMGVRVVIATARPPRSVREIYGHLELDTLSVNYNGALIHDPLRKAHMFHKPIDPQLAMQIVKLARKVDPGVVVSVEILDKWYTDHLDETLPTETSKAFTPDFIGPLEAFLTVPVTKLMLLAPPARLVKVRDAVAKKFAGKIMMAVSDAHLLQLMHPEVDKGNALAQLAAHYKVPRERVMAVGDAPNDLGMIRWAGLGVAMENAWTALRDEADAIVPSNDEDGVAIAIQRFILDRM